MKKRTGKTREMRHPVAIEVAIVAAKKSPKTAPLTVDGRSASSRLDRPSRRMAKAAGGAVNGPMPSLREADHGIKYDDMHREIRRGKRQHAINGGDPDDIKTLSDAQRCRPAIAISVHRSRMH